MKPTCGRCGAPVGKEGINCGRCAAVDRMADGIVQDKSRDRSEQWEGWVTQ